MISVPAVLLLQAHCLVVGLDASGKSTIIEQLKAGPPFPPLIPRQVSPVLL